MPKHKYEGKNKGKGMTNKKMDSEKNKGAIASDGSMASKPNAGGVAKHESRWF